MPYNFQIVRNFSVCYAKYKKRMIYLKEVFEYEMLSC